MKCLSRNKSRFYYSLYLRQEPVRDSDGNETGERRNVYADPVEAYANISSAQGVSQTEQFGFSLQYDKVIVTDDINCPIDESTVLFVDAPPLYTKDGRAEYDYIVKKISRSLNSISIAVGKVKIS